MTSGPAGSTEPGFQTGKGISRLYHFSPRAARDDILRRGLVINDYGEVNLTTSDGYAAADNDRWLVNVVGLELELEDTEESNHIIVKGPVSAKRLTLDREGRASGCTPSGLSGDEQTAGLHRSQVRSRELEVGPPESETSLISRLEDLISSLWLYLGYHAETQLTTEQKNLYYDVVDRQRRLHQEPGEAEFEPMERWWEQA